MKVGAKGSVVGNTPAEKYVRIPKFREHRSWDIPRTSKIRSSLSATILV